MILCRADYDRYQSEDARALGVQPSISRTILRNLGLKYEIWDYRIRLRRTEYLANCGKPLPLVLLAKYRLRRAGIRLGFSIPPNTFGPGLSIAHRGDIIVNGAARVGSNCRIHAGVNIGTAAGQRDAAPIIGDNCCIGPGAKLFGPIRLGDAPAIGANAVVNRSFTEGYCTIGGIPARKISAKSAEALLVKGTTSGARYGEREG